MLGRLSEWLPPRRSPENPAEHVATELLTLLDTGGDAAHMDKGLRELLRSTIGEWRGTPETSPEKLGQKLKSIVFTHDSDPDLQRDVGRLLAQLHGRKELTGHQPDWNGIVLVGLLRIIEKKIGKTLFH